jgi:hypothetical protein
MMPKLDSNKPLDAQIIDSQKIYQIAAIQNATRQLANNEAKARIKNNEIKVGLPDYLEFTIEYPSRTTTEPISTQSPQQPTATTEIPELQAEPTEEKIPEKVTKK